MFCFNHASAFYTNNRLVKMLMNIKLKAQSLNRKSYLKFTLSWFSFTCFKNIGLLWPISALDRKQVRGYRYRNPSYKPKTVWRPSQVYNKNRHTNKTVPSKWIEAPACNSCWNETETEIKIQQFSYIKMDLKMSAVKWWPSCLCCCCIV